jgi:hypothetical protein
MAIDPSRLSPDALKRFRDQIQRSVCEDSLYDFLKTAWPVFDPAPFTGGWHLQAIAEHLEAVTAGHIRKLLVNIRPRSTKTRLVSVAWPAWTWAQESDPENRLRGAGVQFLCASYGAGKAQQDGLLARRIIGSEWYQRLWGNRVVISKDQDNREQYDTIVGGSRISTGIPESLGKGGLIRIIDDPHKTDEIESDLMIESVIRNYREIWQTRANDPNIGAEVMVMQRQGEGDLSGYWLDNFGDDLVHLCIPGWFEEDRACTTYVNGYRFWSDPREYDGESFWPQRYGAKQRKEDEDLGPFAFAGQIQQRPEPRGAASSSGCGGRHGRLTKNSNSGRRRKASTRIRHGNCRSPILIRPSRKKSRTTIPRCRDGACSPIQPERRARCCAPPGRTA